MIPPKVTNMRFWCQKVLPLVYDNSLSYYETLCKVVDYLNSVINNVNSLTDICIEYGVDIKDLQEDVKNLQNDMQDVKNGKYVDLYLDSIKAWIDANLQKLVGGIVKYVVFGLSMDGHFTACIPECWNFIEFDTIMDPNSKLYGHLTLRW